MNLLLDTCTFLWAISAPDQLSQAAKQAVEDRDNRLSLSQASMWQIQIKYQSGKLTLTHTPKETIELGMERHDVDYQSLASTAIWQLQKLPLLHKDPFDRIIIASALCEGMTLVSPDPEIHKYPVPVIW
jgi:PIN domain nuclease of toxin-antitoxin system